MSIATDFATLWTNTGTALATDTANLAPPQANGMHEDHVVSAAAALAGGRTWAQVKALFPRIADSALEAMKTEILARQALGGNFKRKPN
jgi:hypothetical protein